MAARRTRRKKAEPASVGLEVDDVAVGSAHVLDDLEALVTQAGGNCLARYRDPLGGSPLALAALPLETVAPTPFQRDLSEPHVKRLGDVIGRVGIFLDPVIAVPMPEGAIDAKTPARFWTPNGYHRLSALQQLGAKTLVALLSPDPALAYRILALNTEKAHNLRERSLEAARMARGLSETDPHRPESEYALELEDGSLVTLGFAYEKRPRFAGGAYAPALKASDGFLEVGIQAALDAREKRADRLLAIDLRVAEIVKELKERGFESPYIKNFVVARLRPFRPRGKPAPEPEALLDHMEKAALGFNLDKIKADQVAKAGGSSED